MAPQDESGKPDIDPAYDALFRSPSASDNPPPATPETPAPVPPHPIAPQPMAPLAPPPPLPAIGALASAPPGLSEPEIIAAAVAGLPDVDPENLDPAFAPELSVEIGPTLKREPVADTGRLFRSQGVRGHDDTVLALTSDHGGRLRTLDRGFAADAPATRVAALALEDAGVPDDDAAMEHDQMKVEPAAPEGGRTSIFGRRGPRAAGRRAISAGAVYIVMIGVTVAIGFLNAWLGDGKLGWPTGLALLLSTLYCAVSVRRDDDVVPVIMPPIAFLITALTAGQLFLGASAGGLLNRAVVLFFNLGENWIWIIGSTVLALVIVVIRRRR